MKKLLLIGMLILIGILVFSATSQNSIEDTENQVITVAGDNNHPPYEYVDENGYYKGFNVDIMRAVAIERGIDIEFVPMKWEDAIQALQEGEVDAIQGMSKTNERSELFSFTMPTANNSQAIFVLENTNYISRIEDLSGASVSFQKGDVNEKMIQGISGIVAVPKKDQSEAINAILNGESDAFIGNRLTGLYYLQKQKRADVVKIVGDPMGEVEYGPAVAKGNTRILRMLNSGIENIQKNRTYDKIYKKWFGESFMSRSYILQAFKTEIILGGLITIIIVLIFILWNKKLKKEVLKRTLELENANKDLLTQKEKIHNLAYYDTVTGLPNRLYFIEELDGAIKTSKKHKNALVILNLDLDGFKHVNDTLGHDIGDKVLKLVGERICQALEEEDIFARVGGDEFYVLLTNTKDDIKFIETAETIIKQFKESFEIDGHEVFLATSIGIAKFPEGGEDFQGLMKSSDLAMYKAKNNGGNSYFVYNKSLSEKELETRMLANKLRQAEKNKELKLYYQPKMKTATGQIVGMEALLRWRDPIDGFIPPSKFIPIAEETGLIVSIGDWVLWEACRKTKDWVDKGYDPIRVSVNISARQFQNQNVVESISRVLKDTKLDPQYLELEITESIAIIDMDYTINVLKKLKNLGIYISIDDFGTGYSSLSYLREMHVDELKIDKSFIQDIDSNPKNMEISKAIILLAHQINLQVTAEGVETEGQLKFLRENKCDKIQGYYYNQPMPSTQFEELLKRHFRGN